MYFLGGHIDPKGNMRVSARATNLTKTLLFSILADLRLRFLTLLAAVVAGVCSLVTARQFGAGVLEDSFASRLSTYYRTSAQFMALYGLLNFYLYTMAYVYAPALQQVYGQREYLLRGKCPPLKTDTSEIRSPCIHDFCPRKY